MQVPTNASCRAHPSTGRRTADRAAQHPEIVQLRLNAEKRRAADIAALCEEVLLARPKSGSRFWRETVQHPPLGLARHGSPNREACRYAIRARAGWGAVRKSDGMVVMNLWADSIESKDGRQLLTLGV